MKKRLTPREQLAQHLRNLGYQIEAEQIQPARGYWRLEDVYRWECYGITREGESQTYSLCGWDTVSMCGRNGVEELSRDEVRHIEFTAKVKIPGRRGDRYVIPQRMLRTTAALSADAKAGEEP